jgi:hypothetical protein
MPICLVNISFVWSTKPNNRQFFFSNRIIKVTQVKWIEETLYDKCIALAILFVYLKLQKWIKIVFSYELSLTGSRFYELRLVNKWKGDIPKRASATQADRERYKTRFVVLFWLACVLMFRCSDCCNTNAVSVSDVCTCFTDYSSIFTMIL